MNKKEIDEIKKSYDIAFGTGFNWYINHLTNALKHVKISKSEIEIIESNIERLITIRNIIYNNDK